MRSPSKRRKECPRHVHDRVKVDREQPIDIFHVNLLELAREAMVEITQNEALAPIYVRLPEAG